MLPTSRSSFFTLSCGTSHLQFRSVKKQALRIDSFEARKKTSQVSAYKADKEIKMLLGEFHFEKEYDIIPES